MCTVALMRYMICRQPQRVVDRPTRAIESKWSAHVILSAKELPFQVQSRCIGRLHQTRNQIVGSSHYVDIAAIGPHPASVAESLPSLECHR